MTAYNQEISKYGDLFTVLEFEEMVESGMLIDYDGYGHACKNGRRSSTIVTPSKIKDIPEDATHVVWYNK